MTVQNLINELAADYTQSKYNKEHLKQKINEILELILPNISVMIKDKNEKDIVKLWNVIKENKKIDNLFSGLFKKIERPIVIYFASKFKNNKHFGIRIIEEALKSEVKWK